MICIAFATSSLLLHSSGPISKLHYAPAFVNMSLQISSAYTASTHIAILSQLAFFAFHQPCIQSLLRIWTPVEIGVIAGGPIDISRTLRASL